MSERRDQKELKDCEIIEEVGGWELTGGRRQDEGAISGVLFGQRIVHLKGSCFAPHAVLPWFIKWD